MQTEPQDRAAGEKRLWLIICLIGGVAVLGSYAWGLSTFPELRGALWGELPHAVRPVYTVNMFLAAAGWIAVAWRLLTGPPQMTVGGRPAYLVFALIQMLILIPSAFWMPLTFIVLIQGGAFAWTITRACLLLVGVGAVLQVWAVWRLSPRPTNRWGQTLLIIGALFFALQTAVLDGLVWPEYFVIPQ